MVSISGGDGLDLGVDGLDPGSKVLCPGIRPSSGLTCPRNRRSAQIRQCRRSASASFMAKTPHLLFLAHIGIYDRFLILFHHRGVIRHRLLGIHPAVPPPVSGGNRLRLHTASRLRPTLLFRGVPQVQPLQLRFHIRPDSRPPGSMSGSGFCTGRKPAALSAILPPAPHSGLPVRPSGLGLKRQASAPFSAAVSSTAWSSSLISPSPAVISLVIPQQIPAKTSSLTESSTAFCRFPATESRASMPLPFNCGRDCSTTRFVEILQGILLLASGNGHLGDRLLRCDDLFARLLVLRSTARPAPRFSKHQIRRLSPL